MSSNTPLLSIQLSARGLGHVRFNDDTFVFRVGDDLYVCPRIVADFISLRIARIGWADESFRGFEITMANCEHLLCELLSVEDCFGFSLSEGDVSALVSLSIELENAELSEQANHFVSKVPLTILNSFERLHAKRESGSDFCEICENCKNCKNCKKSKKQS
jgi:hypothetical protein